MTLHLHRLHLTLSTLHRWAADRALPGTRTEGPDEGLALHHLLTECFGRGAFQPFRLMVRPDGRAANLYGYSTTDGGSLRQMAQTIAPPEHLRVIDAMALDSKPLPPFAPGQRLGFDLRIRPVVRLRAEIPASARGKGINAKSEIDAFLARVLRDNPDNLPERQESRREDIYRDWLAQRLDGATLDPAQTRMTQFRRRRTPTKGGPWSEAPEAIFHGTLTVTDPTAFATRMAQGVGRHSAYGYGLILLRAPQAPPPPC